MSLVTDLKVAIRTRLEEAEDALGFDLDDDTRTYLVDVLTEVVCEVVFDGDASDDV